jgi:hypothetical protein
MIQHRFRCRLRNFPQRVAVGKARLGAVVWWRICAILFLFLRRFAKFFIC